MFYGSYAIISVVLSAALVWWHLWAGYKLFNNWKHATAYWGIGVTVAMTWANYAFVADHWRYDPEVLLGIFVPWAPIEDLGWCVVPGYVPLLVAAELRRRRSRQRTPPHFANAAAAIQGGDD